MANVVRNVEVLLRIGERPGHVLESYTVELGSRIFSAVVKGNPRKTGESQAGWNTARNRIERKVPGKALFHATPGQDVYVRGARGFRLGDRLNVSNAVPHTRVLALGRRQVTIRAHSRTIKGTGGRLKVVQVRSHRKTVGSLQKQRGFVRGEVRRSVRSMKQWRAKPVLDWVQEEVR